MGEVRQSARRPRDGPPPRSRRGGRSPRAVQLAAHHADVGTRCTASPRPGAGRCGWTRSASATSIENVSDTGQVKNIVAPRSCCTCARVAGSGASATACSEQRRCSRRLAAEPQRAAGADRASQPSPPLGLQHRRGLQGPRRGGLGGANNALAPASSSPRAASSSGPSAAAARCHAPRSPPPSAVARARCASRRRRYRARDMPPTGPAMAKRSRSAVTAITPVRSAGSRSAPAQPHAGERGQDLGCRAGSLAAATSSARRVAGGRPSSCWAKADAEQGTHLQGACDPSGSAPLIPAQHRHRLQIASDCRRCRRRRAGAPRRPERRRRRPRGQPRRPPPGRRGGACSAPSPPAIRGRASPAPAQRPR